MTDLPRFYVVEVHKRRIGWRVRVEEVPASAPPGFIENGYDHWHAVAARGWWRPTRSGALAVAERRMRQRAASYDPPRPPVETYEFRPDALNQWKDAP